MRKNIDPNRKVYIYKLLDPLNNNKVRYVGWSFNIKKRLASHIYEADHPEYSLSPDSHKNRWIRKLLENGVIPMVEAIEETDYANHQEREKYWISFYGRENLVNGTDGGDGFSGKKSETNDNELSLDGIKVKLFRSLKTNLKSGLRNYIEAVYGKSLGEVDENTFIEINSKGSDFNPFDFESKKMTIKDYKVLINNLKNPYKYLEEDDIEEFFNEYIVNKDDEKEVREKELKEKLREKKKEKKPKDKSRRK